MSLPRILTLFGAIMLVVGNVVGAGIFTTSGMLAAELNNPVSFLMVWILGGLLTVTGALTYAELGAMFPRAGGDYQFLKEAYGSWAGFLIGWLSFWVISPGSIAALSIAFVGYLPGVSFGNGEMTPKLLAVAVVVALSFVNCRSTRLASSTQSIVTVGSLILLAGLVVGGAIAGKGDVQHFAPAQDGISFTVPGSAMIAVLFTYSGWFAAAYVGSEVKNPGRNVPLSLFLGTVIVTVLYTGVNAIYVYAMPLSEMGGTTNVAQVVAVRLFGTHVAIGVSIAILLAIGSCINATVMTGARVCYAMAEDGLLPSRLKAVHPRYSTPYVAIIVQAMLAIGLVALGTFDALLAYVVFAMLLSSLATGIAHIVLRIQRPSIFRPYRTMGYPAVPIVFIAAYGWIAVSIAVNSPGTSLLGLGLAFTGIPFFFFWRWRNSSDRRKGK